MNYATGRQVMGGPARLRPGQHFTIEQKDFGSIEQVEPLRVIYGRAEVAGVFITPLFGFRAVEVKRKVGK